MALPIIQITRKPRIHMPVEAIRELVSLVPINLGEHLFCLSNPTEFNLFIISLEFIVQFDKNQQSLFVSFPETKKKDLAIIFFILV